ncbi:MAG TPA: hypothetical protein VGL86_10755 [Polyangia bacterium]
MGNLARSAAPLLWLPLAACLSPPVASPRTTVTQESTGNFGQDIKSKVDILFMIDNSISMDPMQIELRQRFGDFFQVFQDLADTDGTFADLHIGVVTSDYGAGDLAGNGCDASPGGQRGLLQTIPSPKATNPPTGCLPPVGKPYIAYAFGSGTAAGAPTTNLPNGTDAAALVDEFTCMASVGAAGCGFEHQLESVYAALHDHADTDNAGFLRADALLAVVFVTNEDDGSAPPAAKFYENNGDTSGTTALGQFTTYRQTRFAVDCGAKPIPYGMPDDMLTDCAPAPNPTADPSLAYDVSRYISFFTKPAALGGVKVDPNDVILVGIMGPTAPFQTRLIVPGSTQYQDCPSPMLSSSCLEALDHSCTNHVQPGFFADPAVRLAAVIGSAANQQISSICGDDVNATPDFTSAMKKVGELIGKALQPACINAPVASRRDGTPDCVVEDVTTNGDGSTHTAIIPSCAENGDAPPCWQLVDLLSQYQMQGCVVPPAMSPPSCKLPASCQPVTNPVDGTQQLASIAIDRGGVPAAANTAAHVDCATIASSSQ